MSRGVRPKDSRSDQIKKGMDSDFKKNELDRINRMVRIMRPSAESSFAGCEKNPDNPVDPV